MSDLKEIVRFVDKALDKYFDSNEDAVSIREQYALSQKLHDALVKSNISVEEFDQILYAGVNDIAYWLGDLPLRLAHYKMVDEASEVCNHFSKYFEAENFLGDLSVILAEAGRKEEALNRIETNLDRFPEDVWVVIKAGDALEALKETGKALELYRLAYNMSEAGTYDREGVLERLIPMLREIGNDDEADIFEKIEEHARKKFIEDWDRLKPVSPIRREKIGRNELCPCGSGKKYKKCCLPKK